MSFILHLKLNSIINVLLGLLICSFTILYTYTWGRYVVLACIAGVFVLDAIQKGLKYRCVFGQYFVSIALFTLYALASSLWAEAPSDAIAKAKTLFELLTMTFVLYNCYHGKDHGIQEILTIIKWTSFIVVLYSLYFYGIDTLTMMVSAETRMENAYANINTIGMLAAIGFLIQIDEILQQKRLSLPTIFCAPSVFLIAMTQSRKAFVVLIVGIVMDVIWRNIDYRDFRKVLVRLILSVIAVLLILYLLLSLPLFTGVLERMSSMLADFTGVGKVDNSTHIRHRMMKIGLEQFFKTPILGIGIGNPHLLSAQQLAKDTYLHNNFVELLAGGGIIGFGLYYSMYAYLFINFWRYRKHKNKEYIICAVIMLLLFAMDYGMVSYYTKSRYIYLMLYFLEVEALKRSASNQIAGTVNG